MNDIKHQLFFEELLADTDREFKKSPVCKKQENRSVHWNYSICGTPILKEKGIIFGINWGGSGDFSRQEDIPTGEDIVEYRFIKQNRLFLEEYWELNFSNINFNYTNLCFFRTPSIKDLVYNDFELSLPLFEKYVKYIKPPWLLSIGVTNITILKGFGALTNIKYHFDGNEKFCGHSAILWNYPIFSAPHPGARMSSEARLTIWQKVTEDMVKQRKV